MASAVDEKMLMELDQSLKNVNSEMAAKRLAVPDICGTYKTIRPALGTLVDFLSGLPGWLKPGWLGTVISALQTLMKLLDQLCH